MKVYRASSEYYSQTEFLVSGEGSLNGQRWNLPDSKALYTSSSLEGALSELAYYKLTSEYIASLSGSSLTAEAKSNLSNVKIVISELEVLKKNIVAVDLCDPSTLLQYQTSVLGKEFCFAEMVKSAYTLLDDRWTQDLGTRLLATQIDVIKVPSARMNKCVNFVFSVEKEITYKITKQTAFILNFTNATNDEIWDTKKNPDIYKIHYESCDCGLSGVLNLINN